MRSTEFFVIILYLLIPSMEPKALPKYIHACSLKHDLRECFLKNGNEALPFIIKGDSSYNIPNMLPLKIPFIPLISSGDLILNVTDLEVNGLDKAKVIDVVPNTEKDLIFTVVLNVPDLIVEGTYGIKGKIMSLPLNGQGKFQVNLVNGIYKCTFLIDSVNRNGVKYFNIVGRGLDMKFDKIHFDLGNIIDGDEKLSAEVNKFMNENWSTLLTEFGPLITKSVFAIVEDIFNSIAKDVPAEEVFLAD